MASGDPLSQCVALINQAKMSSKEEKHRCLAEVQEIALEQHPHLISDMISPICEFQADQHPDVRKFVADFVRDAAKKLPDALPQALSVLRYLINDQSPSVVKRVLLAATDLFRRTIHWLSHTNSPQAADTWEAVKAVKAAGFRMLDGENDSVRTHAIKLCDAVILGLSNTSTPKPNEPAQACLSTVPAGHALLDVTLLEAEGQVAVTDMAARLAHGQALTKTSLPLLLNVLHGVMKQRANTVSTILPAMIAAAKNAAKSSHPDKSLSENFKRVFSSVSQWEGAAPWYSDLGQRLYHLGAKKEAQELMKRGKKRKADQPPPDSTTVQSRARNEAPRDDPRARKTGPRSAAAADVSGSAADEWPAELKQLLADDRRARAWDPTTVASLVLSNFSRLPSVPSGTAPPLTEELAAALVPLSELFQKIMSAPDTTQAPRQESKQEHPDVEMQGPTAPQELAVVPADSTPDTPPEEPGAFALQRFLNKSGPRAAQIMQRTCGERASRAVTLLSNVLVAKLAGLFEPANEHVMNSALVLSEDGELALHCLHREFAMEHCHGLLRYSSTFQKVLEHACEKISLADDDTSRAAMSDWLKNLLLHAPMLEYNLVLPRLEQLCVQWAPEPSHLEILLQLVHSVMTSRPSSYDHLLKFCLDLSIHENDALRQHAVQYVCKHLTALQQKRVEAYATEQLKALQGNNTSTQHPQLELFCALCVSNNGLLRELVLLFPDLAAPVQLSLSKALAEVMPKISAESSEVAELIQDFAVLFPDKQPPLDLALMMLTKLTRGNKDAAVPPALLGAVMELHSSCDDPRLMATVFPFLPQEDALYQIPVIMCLPQDEMQASFSELLDRKQVSPADLLVELHNIDPEGEDSALTQLGEPKLRLRKVIEATAFCFTWKELFTSEVFAAVIQRLVDQSPLPKLFMRTVIQAIRHFDKLSGFVIEILRSLVTKEIWKDESQWKGFVKCCEYLGGKCIPVLLQLPVIQFKPLWTGELLPAALKSEVREFVASAAGSTTPSGYKDIINQ
eukprot:TRINITY_DN7636_c0_g1_i1.p1 TRINITY_DN7636_c0_g1~~TRINITY_DN7636_c0_g1_i1.p1  ORF type:complete len:1021 (+),score=281.68 TRINITY_DN7636_c0_g1_i1:313-3375(+)